MGFIWSFIVRGIIGTIVGAITNKGSSMGIIANAVTGLVGSALDQALLGSWGPSTAGIIIVPSSTGIVILVLVVPSSARKL